MPALIFTSMVGNRGIFDRYYRRIVIHTYNYPTIWQPINRAQHRMNRLVVLAALFFFLPLFGLLIPFLLSDIFFFDTSDITLFNVPPVCIL